MVKGYEKHQQRQQALTALGRHLVRRCNSKCELCENSGVPLLPVEVQPLPEEPEIDSTILICDTCKTGLSGNRIDKGRWVFLQGVVWSDVAPVQVTAVRMLRLLAEQGFDWAQGTLDGLYLDPEIEEWINQE